MADGPPILARDEIARYARHLVLSGIGGPGQQRLKRARVLVIGAGGLGSPVLQYLAAAGVGTLGLADPDVVSLSNLQRQVIHDTAAIGMAKVESAAAAIARINPHVAVEAHRLAVDTAGAGPLVGRYDVVADCTDNPATRYVISDACFSARRPLVAATVGQFDGAVTTLIPFMAGPGGAPNPTYRCLYPELPPDGALPTCAQAGVLGAAAGVIGALQATEIVKLITGAGTPLVGRLLLVDLREMRFETIRYAWSPDNPLTGIAAAAE